MGRLTPGLVWETQKRMTTPFPCKKEAPNKIPGPCWGVISGAPTRLLYFLPPERNNYDVTAITSRLIIPQVVKPWYEGQPAGSPPWSASGLLGGSLNLSHMMGSRSRVATSGM